MSLEGKIAIVTGSGGGGSGRAIARRFAAEGAAIIVNDINPAGGLETVSLIESAGGRAAFFEGNAGSKDAVHEMFAFAESKFGGVDILVNNASDPDSLGGPLDGWVEAVQVELLGPMHATLEAIAAMRRRGGGAIVNIGSTSAIGHGRKHSRWPGYDVAKMAVTRLTTTLGFLHDQDNIRVNCLIPSWIASPAPKAYWDSLTPEQRKERGVPATLLSLDEVAGAVLRLATDESLYGRIMIWWNGEPPRLIAAGDTGYSGLEDL